MQYARSGDVTIAYQRYGNPDGMPVIAVPPLATAIEQIWDHPPHRKYFERWGAFADVVHFDKRGCGASDRVGGAPSVEERMDDIRAVMDAVGFERATLYGLSEGGGMAMLFAATYPERVAALVLHGTFARILRDDDFPIGYDPADTARFNDDLSERWGTPDTLILPFFVPSQQQSEAYRRWLGRYERAASSPSTIRQMMELNVRIDVRHALPAIQCPTLVLHATGDLVVPSSHGEWLADHIAGAKLVTYPGVDHFPTLDRVDEQLDAIEEFLTGQLGAATADRVLATVLFTDIVDSTRLASDRGDTEWRRVLDLHDDALKREVARHGGRFVNGTGDGLVATFDSPSRAIRAARACTEAVEPLGLQLRTGLHTGEVERRGDDIAGIAVHIAARVAALASGGEVLVSASVPPLVVGSEIGFAERGVHALKGIEGDWPVLAATVG
jgi:pimeloyl-ACP methyl ester carboxylesterase